MTPYNGASRRRILLSSVRVWMGGTIPLGYEVRQRRLVVVPEEAETVRHIYRRYLELGSVRELRDELDRDGPLQGSDLPGRP